MLLSDYCAVQEAVAWQRITSNIYVNRRRKEQHVDDIETCVCSKPANGELGCGPECLNRPTYVECHPVSSSSFSLGMLTLSQHLPHAYAHLVWFRS